MRSTKYFLIALTFLAFGAATSSWATNLVWTNGSGNFSDSFNWNPAQAPAGGDSTLFTTNAAYTITFTANSPILNSNVFNGQGGVVTVDATGFRWTVTNLWNVADNGNATTTVYVAGGLISVTNAAGNNGTITIGANPNGQASGTLSVTNGAVVTANTLLGSGIGHLGTLLVSGPSTVWSNTAGTGALTIGQSGGSGCSLTVSNGARLYSGMVLVGNNAGGNSNVYNVGGVGSPSTVSNGTLFIGSNGGNYNSLIASNVNLFSTGGTLGNGCAFNSATILAGAVWDGKGGSFGIGASSTSSNNTLVLNGGVITNTGTVRLSANGGTGNSLVMSNGAIFKPIKFILGNGGSNNVAYIGGFGLPSTMSVVGNNWYISDSGGCGNSAIITNAYLYNNGNPAVGWSTSSAICSNNTCTVLAGGVFDMGNSTFFVGEGSFTAGNNFYINQGIVSNANAVDIGYGPGATTVHSVNNTLSIFNGGFFKSSTVTLGNSAGDNGNAYNVGGIGASSLATNGGIIVGGAVGTSLNTMTVSNATLVSNTGTVSSGGSNNTASVLAGGTWNLQNNPLAIGTAGAGNALLINNGTVICGSTIRIGFQNGGYGNSLSLNNGGQLFGGANTVDVGDGNASSGASNNTYQIGGAGLSSFATNGPINVGRGGSGSCALIVTNAILRSSGGPVVGGDGSVGAGSGTSNNTATVSAGGTWDVGNSALLIGATPGIGNSLTVNAGGLVTNSSALTVSANNTLNMQGGVVVLHSPLNVVSVSGTLTGVGTIASPAAMTSGSTFAPGNPVGTLNFGGNLTINNAATLQYNLGTASSTATVGGDLTIGGTLNVSDAGGFTTTTYTLFTYSGVLTNNGLTVGTTPNPSFTYTIDTSTAGQVKLVVAPAEVPPVASFSATPLSGVEPLQVTFTDTSTGTPTSWAWDFDNNGSTDSTVQSPTYVYAAGTYSVKLIACNGFGCSTNTQVNLITVSTVQQSWQSHYGVSADASDPFGTGMSNSNKFLAGFDPTSSAAYLHIISAAQTGNDIDVTYLGANGDTSYAGGPTTRTNVLEFTTGTVDGSYTNNFVSADVTNILSGGTGQGLITNMVDVGGATNTPARYYRVRVLVP